ncbi:MAG: hypothetical protein AABW83_03265 [Nanoarchaeota archaeon]
MTNKKLSQKEKIIADVDDEVYDLAKRIQKKYNLNWEKAKDLTNYSLRVLMLSFPKKWLS